jgi:glycosyltransferase involved in cell wall biosynthesis
LQIGIITTSYPRFKDDWCGYFIKELGKYLAQKGYSIEIVLPEPSFIYKPLRLENISLTYIPYFRPRSLQRLCYGMGIIDNIIGNPWLALEVPALIGSMAGVSLLRKKRWRVIMSHWMVPAGLIGGLIKGQRNHIIVCHSSDIWLLEHIPLGRLLAEFIITRASSILFPSLDLKVRFSLLLKQRRSLLDSISYILPMGIYIPSLPSVRERERIRSHYGIRGIGVLFMGRLVNLKGLSYLIRGMRGLDSFSLLVAGSGPEEESLKKLALELGVRAHFFGVVGGKTKEALFRAADIFVLPSVRLDSGRTEGLPYVLLEAMARQLVPIATNVGGIKEIITSGHTGILIPPKDSKAISSALQLLAKNPELRKYIATKAYQKAKEYSWEVIGPKIERLLSIN